MLALLGEESVFPNGYNPRNFYIGYLFIIIHWEPDRATTRAKETVDESLTGLLMAAVYGCISVHSGHVQTAAWIQINKH